LLTTAVGDAKETIQSCIGYGTTAATSLNYINKYTRHFDKTYRPIIIIDNMQIMTGIEVNTEAHFPKLRGSIAQVPLIEMATGVGWGEGRGYPPPIPPLHWGRGLRRGLCPLPGNFFFDF